MLRRKANADVVAVHPTVTLHLPREHFLSLIQEHPAILLGLYTLAVKRDEETSTVMSTSRPASRTTMCWSDGAALTAAAVAAHAPRDGPRVTGHDVEAARLPAGFSRKEARQVRRLGLVLAITAAFVVLELAGAVLARARCSSPTGCISCSTCWRWG